MVKVISLFSKPYLQKNFNQIISNSLNMRPLSVQQNYNIPELEMYSPDPPCDPLLFQAQLPLTSVEGKKVVRYVAVLALMID
jgi:hypothetical protein